MRRIASIMLSLVCAISTPFFMDAEEPTKANTMNSSCCGAIPDQITPPAEPLFCNGARVDVNADFIYWRRKKMVCSTLLMEALPMEESLQVSMRKGERCIPLISSINRDLKWVLMS